MATKDETQVQEDLEALIRAGADDDYAELEGGGDRGDELGSASAGNGSEDGGSADDASTGDEPDGNESEGGEPEGGESEGGESEGGEPEEGDESKGGESEGGESEGGESEGGESEDDKPKDDQSKGEDGGKRSRMIPRARFDEVNNKLKAERAARKELEERLAKLAREQTEQKPEADPDKELRDKIDQLQDQYEEALMDGDKDKAKKLRAELRQAEEELIDRKAARRAQEVRNVVPEDVRLQETIDDIKAKYPVFDEKSDEFNPDLNVEAFALAKTFVSQGLSRIEALKKAVNYVVKMYDLKPAGDERPEPEEEPEQKPEPKLKKQPTAEQRKAKLELAKKQPPKGVPVVKENEERAPRVTELSEEEFDALPESKKRALRGDYL